MTDQGPTVNRIFLLGWDGATFDLIRPWVAQGKLPAIARLLESGASGPLRSTTPPWTFPAWTSFMTGQNPGKHGIYDFFRSRPGTYDLEYVNGSHRRGATFWRHLSDAGRSVVSISIPCTFPPEPVNGVMISGFDFPGEGPGSSVDARGMYPPELFDELNRTVGPHPIDSPIMKDVNRQRYDLVIEQMRETIRKKAATARYLMEHKPWDCFMILFGESDGAGHHLWRYCDPDSPLFSESPPGLRDGLLSVYQELDREAADLLSRLPADATVMMMSDHGFGGVSDWVIYPNCWLREQAFIRFNESRSSRRMTRLRDALKYWAVANLPSRVQRALYRYASGQIGRFEARVRHAIIDWDHTEAYFDENPYFPVLRVNLKGRQPRGVVEPGKPYEDLRDRLIQALESWRHPETGEPIVEKAYRREELYSGPEVGLAADVIPKWALHRGYNYSFRLSSKSPDLRWIEQIDPKNPEGSQFYTGKSGSHRDDGIFLASGPTVKPGFGVTSARIIDLAPTILYLSGVPVPADMDGRVLEEIFKAEYTAGHAVERSEGGGPGAPAPDTGYSEEDEGVIFERLKSLGYVE